MHEMRDEISEKHSSKEAGDVVIPVHHGFSFRFAALERSSIRAPAREVTSILFAERDTSPSTLSGLTCLVATDKEMQRSIVRLTSCHGRFAWTCRSVGSWSTSHPPPKDSISCTLLVICCTRSMITVC